ncbi:hypothetical protein Ahu01nite_037190 [Winogradskya humida]|uniref:Suppressor of fused-like domain-containing protein n=1 Tax=Winogradskya humida TaxID=113566 RepID=A0ABQ3ZR07_9ACTN|nr:hypothetical protein Ahu01nite_037190 [Actinoplanes humidus]
MIRRVADLIEHLESHLGRMTGGSQGDEETPPGVHIAFFGPDPSLRGATTLTTVGLSRRHLTLPSGEAWHQELLMHVPPGDFPPRAAGLLFQLAGEMVTRGSGLQHGQVIGPRGPLFPGARTTAMVAASPRYLPEEFSVCHTAETPIVLTWLIPITTAEAALIRERGWPALARAFATEDPDLTDPARPDVVF